MYSRSYNSKDQHVLCVFVLHSLDPIVNHAKIKLDQQMFNASTQSGYWGQKYVASRKCDATAVKRAPLRSEVAR
jgi:hypothetical protein